MKRLNSHELEQVKDAFVLFRNQGAIERLRSMASDAQQWDLLIAHYLSVFTGLEVSAGSVRHIRVDGDSKVHWHGGRTETELFRPNQTLLVVNSEDLGKLVDQAVEQAISTMDLEPDPKPVPDYVGVA